MTLVILLLAYCLYGAWHENQRLQAEVLQLNEIKRTEQEERSEETDEDQSFYKQFNRDEDSKKPITPPSSPTIEDYDSCVKRRKFKMDLERTLSPMRQRNSLDANDISSQLEIKRRERTNTSDKLLVSRAFDPGSTSSEDISPENIIDISSSDI
jgi:hypothetical protein